MPRAAVITLRLKNFDFVQKELANLRVEVARTATKKSLRTIAEVVANEIRRAAPVGRTTSSVGPMGGEIRRAIGVGSRKPYANKQGRMIVGIDSRAFYWKFLEFGTKAHTIKPESKRFLFFGDTVTKKVSHPGIAPRPFIRPAWDRVKGRLLKIFHDDLAALILKHKK